LLKEAMSLSKEHKFTLWIEWQKNLKGWAFTMQGELQKGTELMRQGLRACLFNQLDLTFFPVCLKK